MMPQRFRAWLPDLPRERRLDLVRGGCGAFIGILLTGLLSEVVVSQSPAMMRLLLIAPMGAAAVLLFAVPTSPLAQPWPVIGGNCLSALVGVLCLTWIGYSLTGAAVAVGVAIAAMIALRCLHPPGGAAALSAVLGGPMLGDHAFTFVGEVAVNAGLLLAVAYAYNNLTGRPYPHRAQAALPEPPAAPAGVQASDVAAALRHFGQGLGRGDLDRLHRLAAAYAFARCLAPVTCQTVAAPPTLVTPWTTVREARRQMRAAGLAALPVVDAQQRLLGMVTEAGLMGGGGGASWWGRLLPAGLRTLVRGRRPVGEALESTAAASMRTGLAEVAPYLLGDGVACVPVLDEQGRLVGLITRARLIEACRSEQAA